VYGVYGCLCVCSELYLVLGTSGDPLMTYTAWRTRLFGIVEFRAPRPCSNNVNPNVNLERGWIEISSRNDDNG